MAGLGRARPEWRSALAAASAADLVLIPCQTYGPIQ